MGRMHSGGKGISKSSLPYKRSPPSWLKVNANQVEEHVGKLAKRGLTPSQVNCFDVSEVLLKFYQLF
jgi:small subunit ribosomal protein S13e